MYNDYYIIRDGDWGGPGVSYFEIRLGNEVGLFVDGKFYTLDFLRTVLFSSKKVLI